MSTVVIRIPFTPEAKQALIGKLTGGIVIPKVWEIGQQRIHHRGWDHWIVLNHDCRREVVHDTARQIVAHLLAMAGTP